MNRKSRTGECDGDSGQEGRRGCCLSRWQKPAWRSLTPHEASEPAPSPRQKAGMGTTQENSLLPDPTPCTRPHPDLPSGGEATGYAHHCGISQQKAGLVSKRAYHATAAGSSHRPCLLRVTQSPSTESPTPPSIIYRLPLPRVTDAPVHRIPRTVYSPLPKSPSLKPPRSSAPPPETPRYCGPPAPAGADAIPGLPRPRVG